VYVEYILIPFWGGGATSKKGEQMFLANSESKVAMELQHTHTRARI